MAYATLQDVQARLTRTLTDAETSAVPTMLDDAAIIIDAYNAEAGNDAKKVVSCRCVIRALGDDVDIPVGATQGSMSGLGYSQSWTIGNNGSAGELYLTKLERKLLGCGDKIGSYSPVEELVVEAEA